MGIKQKSEMKSNSSKTTGFDEEALMYLLKMGEITGKQFYKKIL